MTKGLDVRKLKRRSTAFVVLASVFSLGLYPIYLVDRLHRELAAATSEPVAARTSIKVVITGWLSAAFALAWQDMVLAPLFALYGFGAYILGGWWCTRHLRVLWRDFTGPEPKRRFRFTEPVLTRNWLWGVADLQAQFNEEIEKHEARLLPRPHGSR